jgi:hypothetical protein
MIEGEGIEMTTTMTRVLRLIETEDAKAFSDVSIHDEQVKEYLCTIYDMCACIDSESPIIDICLYLHGFSITQFKELVLLIDNMDSYKKKQVQRDSTWYFGKFYDDAIDHLLSQRPCSSYIVLARLLECYSGHEFLLKQINSQIKRYYEDMPIFDILYCSAPLLTDTKGSRAWLRLMPKLERMPSVLLPYVHELRFISNELSGISQKVIIDILENYLNRRMGDAGRLIIGYDAQPSIIYGAKPHQYVILKYQSHCLSLDRSVNLEHRTKGLIGNRNGGNTTLCSYSSSQKTNIKLNTTHSYLFSSEYHQIDMGKDRRRLWHKDKDHIIAVASNENYIVYLVDHTPSNIRIIPLPIQPSKPLQTHKHILKKSAIALACGPDYYYYIDPKRRLFRAHYDSEDITKRKPIKKRILGISANSLFLVYLKFGGTLYFIPYGTKNSTPFPNYGAIISFSAVKEGCLVHTRQGIFFHSIPKDQIILSECLPFSNTNLVSEELLEMHPVPSQHQQEIIS